MGRLNCRQWTCFGARTSFSLPTGPVLAWADRRSVFGGGGTLGSPGVVVVCVQPCTGPGFAGRVWGWGAQMSGGRLLLCPCTLLGVHGAAWSGGLHMAVDVQDAIPIRPSGKVSIAGLFWLAYRLGFSRRAPRLAASLCCGFRNCIRLLPCKATSIGPVAPRQSGCIHALCLVCAHSPQCQPPFCAVGSAVMMAARGLQTRVHNGCCVGSGGRVTFCGFWSDCRCGLPGG